MKYESRLIVGCKKSNDHDVIEIPRYPEDADYGFNLRRVQRALEKMRKHVPLVKYLRYGLCDIVGGCPDMDIERGRENYNYTGSRELLTRLTSHPDILHLHNLHGYYFDLRYLPELTRRVPTFLTLHDAWLLSGHCAHSFDCDRWETGCHDCPRLSLYVPIQRDASRYNWKRKKKIMGQCSLYLSTPCEWLMDKARRSPIVSPAIREARVIPNGVDLSIYTPGDKGVARRLLGISEESRVILFSAVGTIDNPWKDYVTMREAVLEAGKKLNGDVVFLVLGQNFPSVEEGRIRILHLPYEEDEKKVADYYRAADVYVHAAKADTFPNSVIEAMACGTTVVATAVGGIPEQVDDGVSGFLVPEKDPGTMAERLVTILERQDLRARMSAAAHAKAVRKYSLESQVRAYLDWYTEILQS